MESTVKLKYPIQLEGNEVVEISLRRPKARDLKTMESAKGGDISHSIELIARLAEMPPSAIEELDAADFQKLGRVIENFLDVK